MANVPILSPCLLVTASSSIFSESAAHAPSQVAASSSSSSSAHSASVNSASDNICSKPPLDTPSALPCSPAALVASTSSASCSSPAPLVAAAVPSTEVTPASSWHLGSSALSSSSSKKPKSTSSAAQPKPPPFYASQDEFLLLPNSRCSLAHYSARTTTHCTCVQTAISLRCPNVSAPQSCRDYSSIHAVCKPMAPIQSGQVDTVRSIVFCRDLRGVFTYFPSDSPASARNRETFTSANWSISKRCPSSRKLLKPLQTCQTFFWGTHR